MMNFNNFSLFLIETKLKTGMVFKTKDTSGDLADKLLYVKKIKDNQITVLTPDGKEAQTTVSLLNVDLKTIRLYDVKTDPKFFSS